MSTLLPRFEQFIRERKYVTNVSPATVEWYRQSLVKLPTETPDNTAITDLIVVMRNAGLKATSVNSRLRCIKAYCRWAGLQTIVPKLKEPQHEPEMFVTDHISRLLKWKPKTTPEHRLSTLIAFYLDTGSRRDEALSVTWPDVDFDNLLVLLHGKGRKDRRVPISLEMRKRLFLFQRKSGLKTGLVFGTRDGTKQGGRNVLRDIKVLCRSLGFEPPARTIHAFRHTFATEYLRRGGREFKLQKQLGHADLTMTRKYSHLVTADLSECHEQLSVLGG